MSALPLQASPPPSSPSPVYLKQVSKVQELKALGSKYEVRAMYALIDFEQMTLVWKTRPGVIFEDILTDERLCTIARFRAFKKAIKIFSKTDVEKLGLAAACLIAIQKTGHAHLRQVALTFRTDHAVGPTYQYITKFIRAGKPKRRGVKALLQYIETLKQALRDAGVRVPPMPAP
jgi:hypothetical protein